MEDSLSVEEGCSTRTVELSVGEVEAIDAYVGASPFLISFESGGGDSTTFAWSLTLA